MMVIRPTGVMMAMMMVVIVVVMMRSGLCIRPQHTKHCGCSHESTHHGHPQTREIAHRGDRKVAWNGSAKGLGDRLKAGKYNASRGQLKERDEAKMGHGSGKPPPPLPAMAALTGPR